MRKTFIAIAAAAVLCATSAAGAPKLSQKDRKDTIEGLLLDEYIAWLATNNCPGMTWNRPLILAARKALGMTEAEKTSGTRCKCMNHRSYGSTSISEVVAGKPVIDATNPIADSPPVNGVLKFFTSLDESLMERLQREFADARLVRGQSFDGQSAIRGRQADDVHLRQ